MDPSVLFLARAPKFNGEVGEVWEKWLCRFEAQTGNSAAGERLAALVGLLDGAALDAFVSLPSATQKDYSKVVDALKAQFGRQVSTLQAHAELTRVRQTASESLENFAARIRELSALAHPDSADGNSALEGFQCNHFICGLRDGKLQEQLSSKNIKTLAEAVRISKEFEKNRNTLLAMRIQNGDDESRIGTQSSVKVNAPVVDDKTATEHDARLAAMEGQMHQLHEMVSAIASSEARGTVGKPRRLPRCYRCGEPGHFRRECPQRARLGLSPSVECFGCGGRGHVRRECPVTAPRGAARNSPTQRDGFGVPSCLCCGQHGHWMAECQYYQGGMPASARSGTGLQHPQQHQITHPEN